MRKWCYIWSIWTHKLLLLSDNGTFTLIMKLFGEMKIPAAPFPVTGQGRAVALMPLQQEASPGDNHMSAQGGQGLIFCFQKSMGNFACIETTTAVAIAITISLSLQAHGLNGFCVLMSMMQSMRGENTHWVRCKDKAQYLVMVYSL